MRARPSSWPSWKATVFKPNRPPALIHQALAAIKIEVNDTPTLAQALAQAHTLGLPRIDAQMLLLHALERAGADCIQLEDQVSPKRCGHFNGKEVIATDEMLGKIKAAVDARRDAGTLILARTDACATQGFEAAVERARRFEEAGADILFVEAVTTLDEIRALPQRLAAPQLMNMVIGGKTPITSAEELATLGYGLVLYANAALQGAVAGMQKALTALRDHQRIDEDPALVAPFAERQRLVRKADWDALEAQYANGRP